MATVRVCQAGTAGEANRREEESEVFSVLLDLAALEEIQRSIDPEASLVGESAAWGWRLGGDVAVWKVVDGGNGGRRSSSHGDALRFPGQKRSPVGIKP
jgi:hypothetical protein